MMLILFLFCFGLLNYLIIKYTLFSKNIDVRFYDVDIFNSNLITDMQKYIHFLWILITFIIFLVLILKLINTLYNTPRNNSSKCMENSSKGKKCSYLKKDQISSQCIFKNTENESSWKTTNSTYGFKFKNSHLKAPIKQHNSNNINKLLHTYINEKNIYSNDWIKNPYPKAPIKRHSPDNINKLLHTHINEKNIYSSDWNRDKPQTYSKLEKQQMTIIKNEAPAFVVGLGTGLWTKSISQALKAHATWRIAGEIENKWDDTMSNKIKVKEEEFKKNEKNKFY